MRSWLLMLGGLLVWAVHFGGSYGIASVFDVISEADAPLARLLAGALTIASLTANAALFVYIARARKRRKDDEVGDWILSVGALNAAVSLLAVLWQGLPAIVGH